MRNRMVQVMHLNRERSHLAHQLTKEPDNVELLQKKADVTDKLLGFMVEEMADMARDINALQARPRFR